MTSWLDRLRIALTLSPALLLLHVWILVCSNGNMLQIMGVPMSIGLMAVSSVVEAYVVVLATTMAIQIWQNKSKKSI